MELNGSQIVLEVLKEQGVDTIFGYPGGTILNIFDELYKYGDTFKHILTAHEQGASHAADGYARATGRTGVVLATSGTVRLYLVVIAAASAVAVVIEVADVCARAHRADRCKNDRAQHQCREKNTNRFFHCFDHRFRKGKASFLAEF